MHRLRRVGLMALSPPSMQRSSKAVAQVRCADFLAILKRLRPCFMTTYKLHLPLLPNGDASGNLRAVVREIVIRLVGAGIAQAAALSE